MWPLRTVVILALLSASSGFPQTTGRATAAQQDNARLATLDLCGLRVSRDKNCPLASGFDEYRVTLAIDGTDRGEMRNEKLAIAAGPHEMELRVEMTERWIVATKTKDYITRSMVARLSKPREVEPVRLAFEFEPSREYSLMWAVTASAVAPGEGFDVEFWIERRSPKEAVSDRVNRSLTWIVVAK